MAKVAEQVEPLDRPQLPISASGAYKSAGPRRQTHTGARQISLGCSCFCVSRKRRRGARGEKRRPEVRLIDFLPFVLVDPAAAVAVAVVVVAGVVVVAVVVPRAERHKFSPTDCVAHFRS